MHLKGRTLLDCSALLPGSYIGKLLAERGARVIKIFNPDRPDPAQSMGALYNDLNDCKELVPLNLTLPESRKAFAELVQKADGLIEGFRPAAKRKLGLDWPTLHSLNPRICVISLVGYPEDGPWAERAGHDLNFEALTGMLSLFREMPALPLGETIGAYDGALSLVCAMDAVSRGGPNAQGSRVVMSFFEVLKSVQSRLIRQYRETGEIPRPGSTLFSGLFPCYRIYSAADGRRISVGAIEGKFWQKICQILEIPEYSDHGYATGRKGEEVASGVQQAFMKKPWKDWAPVFDQADCCVEPVLDYSEVYPRGLQS